MDGTGDAGRRRAARIAAALLFVAGIPLVAVAAIVGPEFAARRFSADGVLLPYTLHWLAIYRVLVLAIGLLLCGGGALALAAPRTTGTWLSRRGLLLSRLALAAGALLVSLAAAEAGFRAFDDERTGHDFDSDKSGFLKLVRPQLNALGFRDGPFDRPRVAGERRILVIGDSFVFGMGVADAKDTFPRLLERELRSAEPVAVFNAGVCGADTIRSLETLRVAAPLVRPDLVIIGYFMNDAESEAEKVRFMRRNRLIPLVSDVLLRRSALWRRLEPAVVGLLVRAGVKTSYLDHLRALLDTNTGAFARHRADLSRLIGEARAEGRAAAVVIFPLFEDFVDYPLEAAHETLRRAFSELGVPCLDLLGVFRGARTADLQASSFDHHPNAEGHRRAARAAAEFLRRERLAKPSAATPGQR